MIKAKYDTVQCTLVQIETISFRKPKKNLLLAKVWQFSCLMVMVHSYSHRNVQIDVVSLPRISVHNLFTNSPIKFKEARRSFFLPRVIN